MSWGPYCERCGHPADYHGATFCQVDAGAESKRICDCKSYKPANSCNPKLRGLPIMENGAERVTDPKPNHIWNDPDGDGHDCIDCAIDSIWKCDEASHAVLLPLKDPMDLLTDEEQTKLHSDLREIARTRRKALDGAGRISLP